MPPGAFEYPLNVRFFHIAQTPVRFRLRALLRVRQRPAYLFRQQITRDHITRAQGRLPEAPPSAPPGFGVAWEPDAAERLARIPAFVRTYVKAHVEKQALRQGMKTITAEFLASRRPRALIDLPRRPRDLDSA